MPSTEPSTINKRNWTIMAALAITGQIAWAVENTWFNNFVYDTITPDPRPVAWMVAASALVATLTTILMGTLSDRIGSRRSFLACFCILIAALLWLQFAAGGWMLFAFAVVYGFAHGGFYTVLSPTIAELFGLRAHGAIFGIAYFWGTLGGAIGPVVDGRIYDVHQSYSLAFWVLEGLAVLGLLFMLGVRPVAQPPARAASQPR